MSEVDTSNDILVHIESNVMTITLNRVEKKNSISSAMYGTMAEALAQADSSSFVRVVVIQGHETVFCAGNDIEDFLKGPPTSQESPVMLFLHAISNFTKPLIASVCGPAVGVGTTMLMHCDLVYAGDNAAFSMPFVNLGLCPEAASSLLVPQMMGYHRAAEALMLGEPFLAEAALEVGFVNRVLSPLEANNYAQAVARKMTTKPLSALVETKRLMKIGQSELVKNQIETESLSFARMLSEPAAREAFTAFLQKRKPDYSIRNS